MSPCDACGKEVSPWIGHYMLVVSTTPDPSSVTQYTVRLCEKCMAGAQHAAARFVAYQRRSRGAEHLW